MTIEMTEDQRRGFLKDEYLFLQGQYEDYDKRSLTIKGWVGSGAAGALALAFNINAKTVIFVPITVAVIVIVVWYLEAYWKLFQYAFGDRIRVIEAYFRDDPDILEKCPDPFQIYHWWFRSKAYPSASGATKCCSRRGGFVLEQTTNRMTSGGEDDRLSPLLDRVPAALWR